ncbi:MAG: XRE family transcriptional regulator [Lachnospiraceae bacterium]
MINRKTTEELLSILNNMSSSSELFHYTSECKQSGGITFSEFITNKMDEKKLSSGQLVAASQIQRNYGYQIINGTRQPGRDKVIALSLALTLSLEEAQRALSLANMGALYARIRRDSILIFALNKHLSVQDTNELLYECSERPLE